MISNKTKTEDANKEFDTLRHEIIADAKDKKNKSEPQAQVLIFINTWRAYQNDESFPYSHFSWVRVMAFNTTFNNISVVS